MPASHVCPDVDHIHTLLMKPGHPFDASFHRLRGEVQPRRRELIAQEVKTATDPVDGGLVRVLLDVPLPDHVFPQRRIFWDSDFQPFFLAPLGKSRSQI
jgi:hypothetical protein